MTNLAQVAKDETDLSSEAQEVRENIGGLGETVDKMASRQYGLLKRCQQTRSMRPRVPSSATRSNRKATIGGRRLSQLNPSIIRLPHDDIERGRSHDLPKRQPL